MNQFHHHTTTAKGGIITGSRDKRPYTNIRDKRTFTNSVAPINPSETEPKPAPVQLFNEGM